MDDDAMTARARAALIDAGFRPARHGAAVRLARRIRSVVKRLAWP